MGMYDHFHRDFALRTKANLERIEERYRNGGTANGVYNVTQLINSCLGMVVFLKEGDHIPRGNIQEFCEDIAFDVILDDEGSNNTLRGFLRRFRNAIAHCRIEAYGEPENIRGFELHDKPPHGRINWRIQIDTASIRALALALVEFVVQNAPQQPEQPEG